MSTFNLPVPDTASVIDIPLRATGSAFFSFKFVNSNNSSFIVYGSVINTSGNSDLILNNVYSTLQNNIPINTYCMAEFTICNGYVRTRIKGSTYSTESYVAGIEYCDLLVIQNSANIMMGEVNIRQNAADCSRHVPIMVVEPVGFAVDSSGSKISIQHVSSSLTTHKKDNNKILLWLILILSSGAVPLMLTSFVLFSLRKHKE